MGFFEELGRIVANCRRPGSNEVKKNTLEENDDSVDTGSRHDVLVDFDGPLEKIPSKRSEVYEIYGRAPKDTNPAHRRWPKAKMVVSKNLPGRWNNGSGKLYTLAYMAPYLREALSRCERLGVLNSIETMGSYTHRHVRHNKSNPLSYHSWGAAIDINPKDNRAFLKSKIGEIAPPFSQSYLNRWPKHLPLEVVLAFKSVGFAWGGDWGHDDWEDKARLLGSGYISAPPEDWGNVGFYDPMHFELISR